VVLEGCLPWLATAPGTTLRCMGVIWFDFHVLRFLPIRYTPTTACVALTNLRLNFCKIWVGNRTYLDLGMVVGSVCMLIS
jgi:hypothetical protein